jgi:hypothetical protein
MDKLEKLTTLGTQDTRRKQIKNIAQYVLILRKYIYIISDENKLIKLKCML